MVLSGTEHMSRCAKCRYYCRTGATFVFSHIGLCSLVFGYTVMGAFTFEALEAPNEQRKRDIMTEAQDNVTQALWVLTSATPVLYEGNWTEIATATLKSFETDLVKAMKKEGFDGSDGAGAPQWSFSGALLYSIIVITTIGYGNIAPKTQWGKIVTILYAIIGIPLLLLCLSNIGDAMAHSFKFIYWKVCCYLCSSPKSHGHRRTRSSRYSSRRERPSRRSERNVERVSNQAYPLDVPTRYGTHQSYPVAVTLPQGKSAGFRKEFQPQFVDAHKVPIITNKYAMHYMEPAVGDMTQQPPHRMGNMDSNPYSNAPRGLTNRPSRPQDPPAFTDDLDFPDDSSSKSEENEREIDDDERSVPITLCISIVVSYICGGASLFSYWEGWEYSDSCYFCFITLTTIGFGDMVPGTAVLSEDAQLALGLCSLYLLFGMALLAMSFNLVQEEVTKSMKSIGRRIGILPEEDDDDDDDDDDDG